MAEHSILRRPMIEALKLSIETFDLMILHFKPSHQV